MANIHAEQRAREVTTGVEHASLLRIDNSPLPPAHELQQIQAIDPTLIVFVKDELTKQYEHQRKIVEERDKTVKHLSIAGLYLGTFITIFALMCSTFLVCSGYVWTGGILGFGTLLSVVTVIVNAGATQRKADKEESIPAKEKNRKN